MSGRVGRGDAEQRPGPGSSEPPPAAPVPYVLFRAAGLILELVGVTFGAVSLADRTTDFLEAAVLGFVAGYAMFFRTLQVVSANDSALTLRRGSRTFAVARGDVLWAIQSGYPLIRRPLILLRRRRVEHRPSWVFIFDDPALGVLSVLRTWGVRGIGIEDGA